MTLMSHTREVSVRRKGRWRAIAGSAGAAVLALSTLGVSAAQAAPPEEGSVFYASPDGRDQGTCQEQDPCSLEYVQGVVRDAAATGTGDVTVVLADGTYRIDNPLEFRAQDGGRNGHTVRWTAAEGAHPEITGSTQLTGWQKHDEAANIYVADTPAGFETRQLYVDGIAAPRASTSLALTDLTLTPTGMTINNPALAYLADLPDQDRIEFESLGDFTDRYSPVQSIVGDTITMTQPAWDNNTWGWDTVQNSLLADSKWFMANSLGFLDKAGEWYIDPEAGKLYYKPANGVNPADLDIELPRVETLISVGGTYDAPVSHLEFSGLTFTGTSWLGPSSAEGYVSQQNGGYIKGVYDYRPADAFANCSRGCNPYERTRNTWFQMPSSVQVSAADHITFAGNTFRNLGSSALGIGNDDNAMLTGVGLGASNIDVTGNVFTQVGGHALFVGGIRADAHHPSDPRMTNQDILIENNTISHVAVEYQDTSGILSTYVTGAKIVHNEVRDLAYAIDTGYGWGINDPGGSQEYVNRGYYQHNPLYQTPTTLKDNLIAGNLVHDIKADFADSGNIYNLSASPGTVIEDNYMYNVSGVGIYLDEGSRYTLSRHNVLSNANPWVFTNAYSAGNGTNDNTLQENWHTGGAQMPNAEARNNRLIDNVRVTGGNWPSAAWEVMCTAGVAPEHRTALNVNLGGLDPRCETNLTKPEATLVAPTTAGPFQTLTLKVDASDNRGLQRIVANIYKGSTLVKSTQTAVGGAKTGTHSATVTLPDGDYTIRYNAQDLNGLISKTGTFAFTIDATAPTVTIKNGANETEGSGGSYSLVSFKLNDAGKIDKLTLNGVEKDLTNNAWSDLNYVKPGAFGAVAGLNTLVVYDVAGNTKTLTFTLN